MKTIKQLTGKLFALMAVATAMLLTGCSSDDYVKVLPKDCTGVIRVDAAQMLEKAGMDADNSDLKDWKEKILEKIEKEWSGKSTDRMKELLDNPEEFGVDLRDPVYFFGPSEKFAYAGMVAKVLSKSDLTEFLEMVKKEEDAGRISEYDECTIFYTDRNDFAIAFDDETLMFAGAIKGDGDAKRDLRKRFETKNDGESIMDNTTFQRMMESEDDVTACLMFGNLMEIIPERERQQMKELTEDYNFDDLGMVYGLNFGDTSVDAWMEYVAESDKAQQQLDKMKEVMGSTTCEHWNMIPADAVFVAGGNFHGTKYWNYIVENKFIAEILQKEPKIAEIVGEIVKGIEGEATMAINMPKENDEDFVGCAFVSYNKKTAADKFFELVEENIGNRTKYEYNPYTDEYEETSMQVIFPDSTASHTRYYLNSAPYSDMPIYWVFGANDKYVYFNTDNNFQPGDQPEESLSGNDAKEQMKGKMAYAYFNIQEFLSHEDINRGIKREGFSSYADKVKDGNISVSENCRVEAHLNLTDLDKDENSLKLLTEFIIKIANKNM